ncbi:MAG: hypothetical protein JSW47_21135 [Phycisphaerales bacterium]|nr:MAG: hypothetical protein JSW47_21135 [Phycisphaerales bacterium]UCF17998.1 MAG: hypothetical protein JSW59_06785 [Phycisphaerales bacterium]
MKKPDAINIDKKTTRAVIKATGSALPAAILDNADLEKMVETLSTITDYNDPSSCILFGGLDCHRPG